jgi:hypothetical protein
MIVPSISERIPEKVASCGGAEKFSDIVEFMVFEF